jgi:hypothetical protein
LPATRPKNESVRGAPVTSLVVEQADLAGVGPAAGLAGESGWVVEDVGPATLVDSAAVTVADGRITIPFLQALGGDAVIELRGSRRLARDADEVAWSLPAPSADLVVPATVAITADSDIEILPDIARSRGLVRQAATGFPRSEADGEAGGLLYRLDAPNGRFVGSRRSLPRRIDATLAVQVDIDETELAVEQLMRLTVVHVPLDAVELLAADRQVHDRCVLGTARRVAHRARVAQRQRPGGHAVQDAAGGGIHHMQQSPRDAYFDGARGGIGVPIGERRFLLPRVAQEIALIALRLEYRAVASDGAAVRRDEQCVVESVAIRP